MNVIEKYLEVYKQCIILLSGFEKLHLSEYAKKLAKEFNFTLIEFKYPEYDDLNQEIEKLLKEKTPKGIIVYGLSFPTSQLKFKTSYHIAISGNRTLINDDDEYKIYQEYLDKSFINKFKNIKDLEFHDDVYDDIFLLCITMIMKRVYGDKYDDMMKKYADMEVNTEKEQKPTPISDDEEDTKIVEAEETNYKKKKGKKSKMSKMKGGNIVTGVRTLKYKL
jgi:hypothetical protein